MSRQRTINDSVFWRSPKMAGRTQEDRATLTYLLTCPFSNIIGAYQLVPRIAASEMGWDTESQFMPILRRLEESGFIRYDTNQSFVWIHIWWDHNYPKMAVAPTLRQKTIRQIMDLPMEWRTAYVEDLIQRLPEDCEVRATLLATLCGETVSGGRSGYPIDRVSIPHFDPIDSGAVNSNYNYKINTTTLTQRALGKLSTAEQKKIKHLLHGIPDEAAEALQAELAKALSRPGHITHSPAQYLHGLIQRHANGTFSSTTNDAEKVLKARQQLKAIVRGVKLQS